MNLKRKKWKNKENELCKINDEWHFCQGMSHLVSVENEIYLIFVGLTEKECLKWTNNSLIMV